jgi:phosphomannomutase
MTRTISLVAFDMDDTLAPSKTPLPEPMVDALVALLHRVPVCIISGGHYGQYEAQLLNRLPEHAAVENLHLMPTCGARYLKNTDGNWSEVYSLTLSADERARAIRLLEQESRRLGLWEDKTWGPQIEDRGSQITFSALGQNAPVDAKKAWDPTGEKRALLAAAIAPQLPELEVRSGGSTSIDITLRGIDKAHGMREIMSHTGISAREIIFFGDRLDEEGNDYPVIALGVHTEHVDGWEDTHSRLLDLLAEIDSSH